MQTKDETARKTPFELAVERIKDGADSEHEAKKLYAQLTEEESLDLLDGDTPFWPGMLSFIKDGYNYRPYVHGQNDRLGIPGIRFIDGPRGCVRGEGTAFPVSMARGATWDVALEERVGVAIGEEVREEGGNFYGGVCINLPRHPAWGRAQETYSDQPIILGRMGAALAKGVQHNAMACMKHFACNSMENARFSVDVSVDEATFNEVYLPHFKYVAQHGIYAVMSSYNSINGEWGGQNRYNLIQVLRDEWNFKGLTVSDFIWGLRDPIASITHGLDIEEPFSQQRHEKVQQALREGRLSWGDIRRSGVRILENQLRFYAQRWSDEPKNTLASDPHTQLAREVEDRAVVLLKNDQVEGETVLPLLPQKTRKIAVFGRLADIANTGDHGSSDVHAPYVVTVLQGLQDAYGKQKIDYLSGGSDEDVAACAAGADAAVVVVGYTAADEGEFVDGSIADSDDLLALYPEPHDENEEKIRDEVLKAMGSGASVVGTGTTGGDRRDLHLHKDDVNLIAQVSRYNPRTVVVVVSAGAVLMEDWVDQIPCLLLGWYSGMEGGHGIADIITGKANPSGHLPYPIPASEDDLPDLNIDATEITYDRYYGQRLIQHKGSKALFPLGYGLSYTTWQVARITSRSADTVAGTGCVEVEVENTGDRDGWCVVQIYGSQTEGDRADERELLGFSTVQVPAHAGKTILVDTDYTALGRWNAHTRKVDAPHGLIRLEASLYWGDPDSANAEVTL